SKITLRRIPAQIGEWQHDQRKAGRRMRCGPRSNSGCFIVDDAGAGPAVSCQWALARRQRHWSREEITPPWQGLDDALLAVRKRHTHVADTTSQRFIGDRDVRPDRFDEFVLWHQTARVLNEVAQNLEALRPQLDLALVLAQAASPQIEFVSLEEEGLFTGRPHRSAFARHTLKWRRYPNFSTFSGFLHPALTTVREAGSSLGSKTSGAKGPSNVHGRVHILL